MTKWGWFGPVFVIAFVGSIAAGSALTTGRTLYLPGASVADLRAFYSGNPGTVLAQSALQALAAAALYLFGRGLYATMWPDRPDRLGQVVVWGNRAAAGFLLLSVLTSLALAAAAGSASADVVAALGKATLLCGGALHLGGLAALVTAASLAGLRGGARTRWVFHYGRWAGPVIAVSLVSIAWPPVVKLEPLYRLLGIVWIVGVAVAAVRHRLGRVPRADD
jgi:hypothetical protein